MLDFLPEDPGSIPSTSHLQLYVTPVPGDLMPHSGLNGHTCGIMWVLGTETYPQVNIYKHKIIKRYNFEVV